MPLPRHSFVTPTYVTHLTPISLLFYSYITHMSLLRHSYFIPVHKVTASSVRLVDCSRLQQVASWAPQDGSPITLAAASPTQVGSRFLGFGV